MKILTKQISKKMLVTLLLALPGVAVFAATNGAVKNASTLSYVLVIGFFASLVAVLVFPLSKANFKSLLD